MFVSGGSEPCLAAWHGRAAQWPLRQLGLGVKACGGHCYPPCMGAYVRLHSNDYPRQVVYGGQRAARPGQIGTQRLISQAQHEGQHSNSMKREKIQKQKAPKGTRV